MVVGGVMSRLDVCGMLSEGRALRMVGGREDSADEREKMMR